MKSRELAAQRRAQRRRLRTTIRAEKRAAAERDRASAEVRRVVTRFSEAYQRWNAHRGGELEDVCPVCGARVVITPRVAPGAASGEFDASHALPACDEFVFVLQGMGAGNARMTERVQS